MRRIVLVVLLAGAAASDASFPVGNRFALYAGGHVSGFFAMLHGASTGDAFGLSVGGGGGASFLLSDRLLVRAGAGYDSYLQLYGGFSISLGATVRLSGPGSDAIPRADFSPTPGNLPAQGYIRFASVELDRVFPVLYKYYDTPPS